MKSLILALTLSLAGVSAANAAEHTRVSLPDVMGVEALGRSFLWSVYYDRVVSDELAAGFGFGSTGTKTVATGVDTNTAAYVVPMYANYYFIPEAASLFATAGIDIVLNINEVKTYKTAVSNTEFNSSAVVPTLGIGYENRSDAGFLVRGAAYLMIAKGAYPWFGMSFGYAW